MHLLKMEIGIFIIAERLMTIERHLARIADNVDAADARNDLAQTVAIYGSGS